MPYDLNTDELKTLLLDPASYPAGETSTVRLVETHISLVFLGDRFVYKLKKPVKFEFLDFSKLDLRRRVCDDEVRLNRRMAGDAYLGVVPLVRTGDGRPALGSLGESTADRSAAGEVVDWVVKMRRLDGTRMLDELIRTDKLTVADVARLADHLARHYTAARPLALAADEYRVAVVKHVRANRADLLHAAPVSEHASVRRTHAAQLDILLRHASLFDARVVAGRVIDGHGDLRPEHICLEDPPVVYDCVEFSADFRRIDVADELTFLEMECGKLGRRDVGAAVFNAYSRASQDRPSDELRAFYESYRACVRCKVAALRAKQQSGAAQTATLRELRVDLAAAEQAVGRFHRPTLYVMRGLMGTGKSTLAAAMAAALGIVRLRTDEVRRELFGASQEAAGYGGGRYDSTSKGEVYVELLRRCAERLVVGESIIADGTFLEASLLAHAADVAKRAGGEFLVIECRCAADVAKQRIAARLAEGRDPSEARPELYDKQAATMESIPLDAPNIVVDSGRPLDEQLATVFQNSPRLLFPRG